MGAEGFFYPNELEVNWSMLIVLYPYITGLVAGAFIVSSLYHVFGIQALKPIARLSLLTALAFLLVAPLPLLAHLGRPERGFEIFWTPHFTSAMAGFGYIWLFYLILVLLETWLVFRRDIVSRALGSRGVTGLFYRALSFGAYDLSEESLRFDGKATRVLSTIGIPSAALLHGYVGFIFGAVKANPWWSSPLMPIMFLLSAIVSGIALLIVVYVIVSKLRKVEVDRACLDMVAGWLLGFLLIDLAVAVLEILSQVYEHEESWGIIAQLIQDRLRTTYLSIQLYGGGFLPALILAFIKVVGVSRRVDTPLKVLAAVLVLVGVFAMRWNVVIGGQLFSKSLRGVMEYVPPVGGQEGILVTAAIAMLPVVALVVLLRLFPPWEREMSVAEGPERVLPGRAAAAGRAVPMAPAARAESQVSPGNPKGKVG